MPLTVPRYVRPPKPSPWIARGVMAILLSLVAAICTSVDWFPWGFEPSLAELNHTIAAEPNSAVHRAARARWYFEAGDLDAAIADVRQ